MKIDNEKAILFLLSQAFLEAHDKIGKNFNEWCKEKELIKECSEHLFDHRKCIRCGKLRY